mmetsp:Transcript_42708/g.89225  ORF Transcript_42708/g.89225 Transcript_42708/m.89225 type:complete len:319 (+) Transcript_42708:178-1134(+)
MSRSPPSLLELPAHSSIKFSAKQLDANGRSSHLSQSGELLANVEKEMGRLLDWAGANGTITQEKQALRNREDPLKADDDGRHVELKTFLRSKSDVTHRRAKRRELAESTAVHLPREAVPGRRGLQREVSYLSDMKAAPRQLREVPDSLIPEAFRIMLQSPLPHSLPLFGMGEEAPGWKYNTTSRQWELPIFPSKLPAGRRDVVLLDAWVNDMVLRLQQSAGAMAEHEVLKEAQLLFSIASHELIRQAATQCFERAHLMGKIWWSEMELFQRMLQMRKSENAERARERQKHAEQMEAMLSQVEFLKAELAEAKSNKNGN